jgi:hypothetical protein
MNSLKAALTDPQGNRIGLQSRVGDENRQSGIGIGAERRLVLPEVTD